MKYQIIIGLVLLTVGYATGRYVQPTKVVTKTETVVKTNDVIHEHVHVVTHTITKTDGTKDTTTVVDNNSTEDKNSTSKSDSSTVTTYSKSQWKVGALVGLSSTNLYAPIYGANVEKRILGPISAGLWATTGKEGGLSISLEF